MTLDDCVKMAQTKSPQAEIITSRYSSSLARYKAFRMGYRPQISLTGAVPGLNRSINAVTQEDGSEIFRPQSNLYSYSDLNVSQKIPLTGATFNVSSGISRIDILESTDYILWRTTPVRLQLIQPILQINNMKWDRRIETIEYKKDKQQYIEDMEGIAIDITRRFFDLYIAQMNIETAKFNVAINDTLYQLSLGRYKVGKIAENDLLQSELALLNSQNLLETRLLDYKRKHDELRLELGLSREQEIIVVPPKDIPELDIDVDKAIDQALANRADILEYQLMKLRSERAIEAAKSNNRFTANIIASYGLNQSAGEIDAAYDELLNQQAFNLTFQIPLYQWGKGAAEIEEAKESANSSLISAEKQKENLVLDIKYQTLSFMQLRNQVAVSAKADIVARKRFEVAKNRYMIQKIDLNTFFIAQNEKDAAIRNYVQNLKNYWVSYYNIRKLTLFDFSNNQPITYEIK